MKKLKWLCSYETIKFDTPDGDIHKGQYAVWEGRHIMRLHPENNHQFTILEAQDDQEFDIPKMIDGLEEIHVLEGEKMYYDEFELPEGRKLRMPSTQRKYRDLAVKNAPPRTKTATTQEITEFKKDDHLWQ